MFGYIVINKKELRIKEFDAYKSCYCGLCRELREQFGVAGQLTINYDMTFLILLLTGLYEPKTKKGTTRCAVHPICKQEISKNEMTEYAAEMNLLLSYYKCVDDWNDDKNIAKKLYAEFLKGGNKKVADQWEKKAAFIKRRLEEMTEAERRDEKNPDKMAGMFGDIMAEIFAYREDVWEQTLRNMGFYLGKFIYLLDAYEDVEEDVKKGRYNLFSDCWKSPGFDEEMEQILMMLMSSCCQEFEILPIISYGEILRNILYSGIWKRFIATKEKRRNQDGKNVKRKEKL